MVELGGGCIIPTRLSKGQRRARRDPGRGRGGSCAGPQTAAKGGSKLVLSASDSSQPSASREWGAPSLGENLFREMDARMTRWLLTARLNRGAGFDLTLSLERCSCWLGSFWGWASAVRSLAVNARLWKMAVMQHDNAACEDGSGLGGPQVAAVWGTCNQRNYG